MATPKLPDLMTLFPLGVLLTLTTPTIARAENAAPEFAPVAATEATLADSEALARLESPGEIFFADGFESEKSLDAYLEIRGREDGRTQLVSDPDMVHSGDSAIQFTAPENEGRESGAGATLWFGPGGYEVVYFRRYIKFAADYDQGNMHHTGGGLSGVGGTSPWGGMGQAGVRPTGEDRFTCSFEPWRDWKRYPAPGYMFLYTYWVDMKQSGDGKYWGNFIEPPEDQRLVLDLDRWYCLEQKIRVNEIGQANGELAAWIDGQLYLHFTGFRWRTAEDVKIKRTSFGIYIHEAAKDNVAWYDDVVLSTGYVGPLAGSPSAVEESSWGSVKSREGRE